MTVHIHHELRRVASAADWAAYHDIRRRAIFDRYRPEIVYNPAHPDESRDGNLPFVLTADDETVGTVRIDLLDADNAAYRLIAIRPDRQNGGHGSVLLLLAEAVTAALGRQAIVLNATRPALSFYRRNGYDAGDWRDIEMLAPDLVRVGKKLDPAVWPPPDSVTGAAATRRRTGGADDRADRLELRQPERALLPEYEAALAAGWSPRTTRDVSKEQLAALRRDPDAFLRDLLRQDGTFTHDDGQVVPRLPGPVFWIWDGHFCGAISLRFVPGAEALPLYVSGHVGYSVVPWKRRRGHATAALAKLLPIARASGLARVLITCDEDNLASRRVILANGGVLAGSALSGPPPERAKLLYWIETDRNPVERRAEAGIARCK